MAYKEQTLSDEMAPKEPSLNIIYGKNVYIKLRESLLDDDCN